MQGWEQGPGLHLWVFSMTQRSAGHISLTCGFQCQVGGQHWYNDEQHDGVLETPLDPAPGCCRGTGDQVVQRQHGVPEQSQLPPLLCQGASQLQAGGRQGVTGQAPGQLVHFLCSTGSQIGSQRRCA